MKKPIQIIIAPERSKIQVWVVIGTTEVFWRDFSRRSHHLAFNETEKIAHLLSALKLETKLIDYTDAVQTKKDRTS